jgi:hypothetical protein
VSKQLSHCDNLLHNAQSSNFVQMNEQKTFEVKVLTKVARATKSSCKRNPATRQLKSGKELDSDRERHSNLQFYYFRERRQDSIP